MDVLLPCRFKKMYRPFHERPSKLEYSGFIMLLVNGTGTGSGTGMDSTQYTVHLKKGRSPKGTFKTLQ
jgi:hypothetical protein